MSLQVVGPDECLIASRVGANVRSLDKEYKGGAMLPTHKERLIQLPIINTPS